MPKMIFINLAVADVAKATAFYEAIGFEKNETFSNERSSAMVWSEAIHVMLLDTVFYKTFTDKAPIDAKTQSGALFALSFDSRADVDAFTNAGLAAGGRELHEAEDLGFMYSRALEDLDGHGWGPMFMDMAAATETVSPATGSVRA